MGIQQLLVGGGAGPLTVTVDVTTTGGYCNTGDLTSNPCTAYTPTVTGYVTGGAPPYTYLWQYVSGTTYTMSASTSIATSFSRSDGTPIEVSGVYRLRVTDNATTIAYSPNVTITTTHENQS